MNFSGLIQEIEKLINLSNGNFITLSSGERYAFSSIRNYNIAEIEIFEEKFNVKLPAEYKNFLITIGACNLYFDKHQLGIKFYELEEIESFTKEVFINLTNPFPNLLLIASNLNNGDVVGYNLFKNSECSLSIYSVEEEYPENWINCSEYITLKQFLEKLLISDGEDYYL